MRILVLSTTTGYQLRSFGDAAGELGIELLFATDRCHSLDDPWRDGAIAVRFHEEEASLAAVIAEARERPIAGVIAVGDRPVVLAARAADALGLPWHTPRGAQASAHKRLARECFASAGLLTPRFVDSRLGGDAREMAQRVDYPAVVKPVTLSGSRGVIRVDSPEELTAAWFRLSSLLRRPEIRAQRTGSEDEVLIEDFVPGPEYAVEGLMTRGELSCLAIFDKPDPLDGPFFEETIYVTPSRAAERVQRAIVEAVAAAARALGLSHGPIHAECRVSPAGVYVLEVAARPIGGLCSKVLRFGEGAKRCSLEHLLIRHALGEDVSRLGREPDGAAVMMIPIPKRGVFKSVSGEREAEAVAHVEEVRITAKPDQLLEPLPEAGSYLGFIFARAPLPGEAEQAVREAHRRLVFQVEPALDVRAG